MPHLWEVPVLWVKHALMDDPGQHQGKWHISCGKIWAYEEREECDVCGKVWGATPDSPTDDQAQDTKAEESAAARDCREAVESFYRM